MQVAPCLKPHAPCPKRLAVRDRADRRRVRPCPRHEDLQGPAVGARSVRARSIQFLQAQLWGRGRGFGRALAAWPPCCGRLETSEEHEDGPPAAGASRRARSTRMAPLLRAPRDERGARGWPPCCGRLETSEEHEDGSPAQWSNKLLDDFEVWPSFCKDPHIHEVGAREAMHEPGMLAILIAYLCDVGPDGGSRAPEEAGIATRDVQVCQLESKGNPLTLCSRSVFICRTCRCRKTQAAIFTRPSSGAVLS